MKTAISLRYEHTGGSVVKTLLANAGNAGDSSWSPGSGKPLAEGALIKLPPLAEGNGNPLQYSCLQNLIDRGAWWATVHGVTKSQTQLND